MKFRVVSYIAGQWDTLKYAWIRYTAAQTALNAIVITANTRGDVLAGLEDSMTNLPFFGIVNLGYAKCVDLITHKLGRFGRVGANGFSVSVSTAFYGYARMTNDTDPLIPAIVAGIVGIVLTNRQVTEIQKSARDS